MKKALFWLTLLAALVMAASAHAIRMEKTVNAGESVAIVDMNISGHGTVSHHLYVDRVTTQWDDWSDAEYDILYAAGTADSPTAKFYTWNRQMEGTLPPPQETTALLRKNGNGNQGLLAWISVSRGSVKLTVESDANSVLLTPMQAEGSPLALFSLTGDRVNFRIPDGSLSGGIPVLVCSKEENEFTRQMDSGWDERYVFEKATLHKYSGPNERDRERIDYEYKEIDDRDRKQSGIICLTFGPNSGFTTGGIGPTRGDLRLWVASDWLGYETEARGSDGQTSWSPVSGGQIGNTKLYWDNLQAGTESYPYEISSANEWNSYAQAVENGAYPNGAYYRLTNDITITKMMGTESHPFIGSFDGGAHKLTFSSNAYATTPENCAPFRYIRDAAIFNLRVDGLIGTNQNRAAGLAASASGSCSFTNCRSGISIISHAAVSEPNLHAGFLSVADRNADVTIEGCVFDGKLGGYCAGGFVGAVNRGGGLTVRNCMFKPSSFSGTDRKDYVAQGDFRLVNCYVKDDSNSEGYNAQGKPAFCVMTAGDVRIDVIDNGSEIEYGVSGIRTHGTGITCDGVLMAGKNDKVYMYLDSEEYPWGSFMWDAGRMVKDEYYGYWTLTMPDQDVTIIPVAFDGLGTDADPYRLVYGEDWDSLAAAMSSGARTDSLLFQLEDSISVTAMVGTKENPFKGVFDGGGHTLTFVAGIDNSDTSTAPFSWVKDATIRNLRTAGTITGSKSRGSGLIGENKGSSTVSNCRVSATISGNDFIGGFCIGAGDAREGDALSLTGCVFDGKITANASGGGFAGWSTPGLRITDSVFAPQEGSSFQKGGTFYYVGGGNDSGAATLSNCFYLKKVGDGQGEQAWAVNTEGGAAVRTGDRVKEYSVSGIVFYENGLEFGEAFFARKGDAVRLFCLAEDGEYGQIRLDGQVIPRGDGGWQFTMPDQDVTVTAAFLPIPEFGTPAFTLPVSTQAIAKNAFAGIGAETVYVWSGCAVIPEGAFADCGNLKLVRLPAGCEIADGAFSGCPNLIGIISPDDEGIRGWARDNCIGYKPEEQTGNGD